MQEDGVYILLISYMLRVTASVRPWAAARIAVRWLSDSGQAAFRAIEFCFFFRLAMDISISFRSVVRLRVGKCFQTYHFGVFHRGSPCFYRYLAARSSGAADTALTQCISAMVCG